MLKPNKKKPSGSGKHQRVHQKIGTKKFSIIRHFLKGLSLNRFEAEGLGDHCLNSTISTLVNILGLEVPRKWEIVPNRFGGTTRVKRYWLNQSDIAIITNLLGEKQ
tara:strand:- start:99 stop:416 length:318 start_codon:yes stop_codon:yes gene_type:complete